MLRFSAAISVLALLAACSASAGVPTQASEQLSAPVVSETAAVAELEGAPAPAAPERVQRAESDARLPMSCDIRTRRTGNGLLVEGVARPDAPGEYELVIRTSGGGNASDLTQAGPFEAAHGRSITLGESEISFGRGAQLEATLTLRSEDGQTCRSDLRL